MDTPDFRAFCARLLPIARAGLPKSAVEFQELVHDIRAALEAVPAAPAQVPPLNIVFDGPPGPEGGKFVEVETDDGFSVNAGEWSQWPDGLWSLRITTPAPVPVAERLPPAAAYHPTGKWCWGFYQWRWAKMDPSCFDRPDEDTSHWLPHWALPLPEPTK